MFYPDYELDLDLDLDSAHILVGHIGPHFDAILICFELPPQTLYIAAVRRRTRDRKVAGSTPGRGAIKSTRSTQPSIPLG